MAQDSEYYQILFLPMNVSIRVGKDTSILEAIEEADLSINTECGGYGSCGKCKVKIVKGNFKKQSHIEISEDELKNNIQLACLTEITDDLVVDISEQEEPGTSNLIQKDAVLYTNTFVKDFTSFGFNHKPLSENLSLKIEQPNIENNTDDYDRIKRSLKSMKSCDTLTCSAGVLKKIPDEIRKKNGEITLAFSDHNNSIEILDISVSRKTEYGIAIDVGTTTIAVLLVDLSDGRIIAEKSDYNKQIVYGSDVINRIIFAAKRGGLKKLQSNVLSGIISLIDDIIQEIEIERSVITSSAIAGNTTMQHLLLGMNPKYIREEPYVPAVLNFPRFKAEELMLAINPNGVVYITPGISSYVGGDITAGVLAAGINRSKELTLYIDLGTNGEIVLGNSDWMTACACSAGPAFEGGGLRCGMRAAQGAINKINIDRDTGSVEYSVIGDGKPKGICGSAVIDIISNLYFSGIINQKGKFNFDIDNERLRKGNSYNEFVLVAADDTLTCEDIVVTEQDLDNLIRTKGAVWAGISTLLKAVNIKPTDIDRIIIAGAFGNYINIENAILIGMLPDLPVNKFSFIGNGSLQGTALALVSDEIRNEIDEISGKITSLELSTISGYMEEFVASLFIPHTHSEQFPSLSLIHI